MIQYTCDLKMTLVLFIEDIACFWQDGKLVRRLSIVGLIDDYYVSQKIKLM